MRNKYKYTILMILVILIIGVFNISYGEDLIEYAAPQPKDITVFVTKPSMGMELILNNNKIQSIEMKLNGTKVDGKYDSNKQAVVYTPSEPLKAGQYKVDLSVSFEGWRSSLNQSWKFSISENAVSQLPSPNDEQKQALNYANNYRRALGLNELKLDSALNAAAMAHSNYMAMNKKAGHEEFVNDKGFIGTQPYNRVGAYGYIGSYVFENVSSGQKDYKESIDGLMDAPYHRISWVNPFLQDLGYGTKDKYYTFELWGPKAGKDKILVYPMENQTHVPNSWDGNETPNPLRFYGKSNEVVGYPISLSYFSEKQITKFYIEKATLTDEKGNTVYRYLNTPANDSELKNTMVMIPSKPLEKGKTYRVSVKGKASFKDNSSQLIDKSWTFTTASLDSERNAWIRNGFYGDIEGHWAKDDLLSLWSRKIILNKGENLFKPDDKITRAEFAEFVVKILGLELKSYEGSFLDVKKESPQAQYIESAYREGIVKGVGLGNYGPNQPITREEMAVMMMRSYEKKGNLSAIKTLPSLTFIDRDKISSWAVDGVKGSYLLGIIKGRDNNQFAPKASATRAEAAVMVKRLMDKL